MEWLGLSFCAQGEYPLESVKACKGFVVLLRGLIYARLWICTKAVSFKNLLCIIHEIFNQGDNNE